MRISVLPVLLMFASAALWAADPIKVDDIQVPPPPFTDGIFPCSECHNPSSMTLNTGQRPLTEAHDDIELRHDEENRWCLDCHDAQKRDSLRLASGRRIGFDVSYKLCGQCHGEKLRDWKAGIHGKRIGEWNGRKQYFLCVNCHSPHAPKFKSMKPLPAPMSPEEIK